MNHDPQITTRRAFSATEHIFLIGPGGVGKSTLGASMALQMDRPLIDLDLEFCDRIGIIGPYIAAHGYPAYRQANLDLALQLVAAQTEPVVFVTASGFLAAEPQSDDLRTASALLATGYAITLLPTLDLELATSIVVERQMQRGFGFDRPGEADKFRHRFPLYRDKGDMLLVSTLPADQMATAVVAALHGHSA
jgi:shikimate kinase